MKRVAFDWREWQTEWPALPEDERQLADLLPYPMLGVHGVLRARTFEEALQADVLLLHAEGLQIDQLHARKPMSGAPAQQLVIFLTRKDGFARHERHDQVITAAETGEPIRRLVFLRNRAVLKDVKAQQALLTLTFGRFDEQLEQKPELRLAFGRVEAPDVALALTALCEGYLFVQMVRPDSADACPDVSGFRGPAERIAPETLARLAAACPDPDTVRAVQWWRSSLPPSAEDVLARLKQLPLPDQASHPTLPDSLTNLVGKIYSPRADAVGARAGITCEDVADALEELVRFLPGV
jgi:hypothetical protein